MLPPINDPIYGRPQLGVHELPGDDEYFRGEHDSIGNDAYEAGYDAYQEGIFRDDGGGFHGNAIQAWREGWDDAEEADADGTEPEIVLPVVAMGGEE